MSPHAALSNTHVARGSTAGRRLTRACTSPTWVTGGPPARFWNVVEVTTFSFLPAFSAFSTFALGLMMIVYVPGDGIVRTVVPYTTGALLTHFLPFFRKPRLHLLDFLCLAA